MKDPIHSISDQVEIRADEFPCDELFAAARTAVLVAEGTTGRVVAVNVAAQQLLGLSSARLLGHPWYKAFNSSDYEELQAAAQQAAALGKVVGVSVSGPGIIGTLQAAFSSFYVSTAPYLLLHLDAGEASACSSRALASNPFDTLDELPIAFVLTDGVLRVEFANRTFLDLVGEDSVDAAAGQNLLRWLDLTEQDLGALHLQMRQRQAATAVRVRLRKPDAAGPMYEVVAIAASDFTTPHWGFILRQSN